MWASSELYLNFGDGVARPLAADLDADEGKQEDENDDGHTDAGGQHDEGR